MNFIDLGAWNAPEKHVTESGAAYARYRNDAGDDWYDTVAHREDRPKGFAIALNEDGEIVNIGDEVSHLDPGRRRVVVIPDYVGTPDEKDALFGQRFDFATGEFLPSERIPAAVSKAQAQMALFNIGLLDDLEAIIKDHPYRPVRIWYEGAGQWDRSNPYVSAIAEEMELTDDQIDALFVAAAKL